MISKLGRRRIAHTHATLTLVPGSRATLAPVQAAAHALTESLASANIGLRLTGPLPAHSEAPRVLTRDEERWMIQEVRGMSSSDGVSLVVTEHGLYNHRFSHWYEGQQLAVASLYDWSRISSLPASAFVAYELVLHGLRGLNAGYMPEHLLHEEARGCLFDFCRQKHEISAKLERGAICAPCRITLSEIGIPAEPVLGVLADVRSLALL